MIEVKTERKRISNLMRKRVHAKIQYLLCCVMSTSFVIIDSLARLKFFAAKYVKKIHHENRRRFGAKSQYMNYLLKNFSNYTNKGSNSIDKYFSVKERGFFFNISPNRRQQYRLANDLESRMNALWVVSRQSSNLIRAHTCLRLAIESKRRLEY